MGILYGSIRQREGTSQVESIAVRPRVKVSADGAGVVSHAGTALLREVADLTGLTSQVTSALADTYGGPGEVSPDAARPADRGSVGTSCGGAASGHARWATACGVDRQLGEFIFQVLEVGQ